MKILSAIFETPFFAPSNFLETQKGVSSFFFHMQPIQETVHSFFDHPCRPGGGGVRTPAVIYLKECDTPGPPGGIETPLRAVTKRACDLWRSQDVRRSFLTSGINQWALDFERFDARRWPENFVWQSEAPKTGAGNSCSGLYLDVWSPVRGLKPLCIEI